MLESVSSSCMSHHSPCTSKHFSSDQAVCVTAANPFNVWVSQRLKKEFPPPPQDKAEISCYWVHVHLQGSCYMNLKNNIHLSLLLRKQIIYSFMHLCHLLADIPEACWRNRSFHFILEKNPQPVTPFYHFKTVYIGELPTAIWSPAMLKT